MYKIRVEMTIPSCEKCPACESWGIRDNLTFLCGIKDKRIAENVSKLTVGVPDWCPCLVKKGIPPKIEQQPKYNLGDIVFLMQKGHGIVPTYVHTVKYSPTTDKFTYDLRVDFEKGYKDVPEEEIFGTITQADNKRLGYEQGPPKFNKGDVIWYIKILIKLPPASVNADPSYGYDWVVVEDTIENISCNERGFWYTTTKGASVHQRAIFISEEDAKIALANGQGYCGASEVVK